MTDTAAETPCPKGEDRQHCEHWYDDAGPCCFCADDSGKLHGDHHPALDCRTCADRLQDGLTTMRQIDDLTENRYRNHAGALRPRAGQTAGEVKDEHS